MKRFQFPLRSVAIVRAHLELRAREAFGVAVRAYVSAEERLATIRAHMVELEGILFAGRQDRFRAAETAAFFRAYRQECAAELVAERQVQAARTAMQASRTAYIEAHRKVKVIHRLEEKARATHRRETARTEQADLDELASYRATRKPSFAT